VRVLVGVCVCAHWLTEQERERFGGFSRTQGNGRELQQGGDG